MQALETIEPLNAFLRDLHGPTTDIADTMAAIVPFPDPVESFEDADVLDLTVRLEADRAGPAPMATVSASVRYATSAGMQLIVDWYRSGLHRLGQRTQIDEYDDGSTRITAEMTQGTRYCVKIVPYSGYRSVKITMRYQHPVDAIFHRLAAWHNGDAPWPAESEPTMIEIATFAQGRTPRTLVLYTAELLGSTPVDTQRSMVDDLLGQQGRTYDEPRPGILFLRDGAYPAETHVHGDHTGSAVTFVGEFRLR